MTTAEEYLTELAHRAVKVVNRLRKDAGMRGTSRFTKGVPLHAQANCVAMSLKGTGFCQVTPYGVVHTDGSTTIWEYFVGEHSARTLREFMLAFDQGLYPQFEIPRSEVKVGGKVV